MSNASSGPSAPPEKAFVHATRIQQSFVAAAEARTLRWLAQRTPRWINSDHLTLLGFLAQCMTGVCYVIARWHPLALLAGIACLAVNWLGDSLDGTLARFRNQQRPRYGFYVDHISDTFGSFFLMGGLALSGYTHPMIAIGMLVAFLMLSIESYLATYTMATFRISFWKFGPTEIRLLLAAGNIALLRYAHVKLFGHEFLLFDIGGACAIAGMAFMLVDFSLRHTAQLYREERIA